MKNTLFAGIVVGAILSVGVAVPAQAGCRDKGTCANTIGSHKSSLRKQSGKKTYALSAPSRKTSAVGKKRAHAVRGTSLRKKTSVATVSRAGARVVSLIESMAPAHGVPTWFALRIAKVESGYNPGLRGRAGEYGVFQLKCATARGIGFTGNCAALLDPAVNVRYGLRHLALAMKSSRGNLRLAASKHNGGLGRRTEIAGYVAKVF